MASLTSPATPRSPAFASTPSTPSTPTGSWRHPLMEEVSRRQAENTFTDASLFKLTKNIAALAASFLVISFLSSNETVHTLSSILPTAILGYTFYLLWVVRALFVWNISEHIWMLLRPADDFADVALTPEQRQLLGLKPDTPLKRSAIQAERFVTPPRYTKSTPTSRSASPLPGNSSPTIQRKTAYGMGAFPQDPPSPLRMGAIGKSAWRSPRSASPNGSGAGSSVTPSNRWAYEKSILSRKADGIRLSPSKNPFGTSR